MRILLINVPHPSIGGRIPDDHLPPLGLLEIGRLRKVVMRGHAHRYVSYRLRITFLSRWTAARPAG